MEKSIMVAIKQQKGCYNNIKRNDYSAGASSAGAASAGAASAGASSAGAPSAGAASAGGFSSLSLGASSSLPGTTLGVFLGMPKNSSSSSSSLATSKSS